MAARILVIEDNPAGSRLMTYLLEAFGYSCLSAQDGKEGWDLAEKEAPELVVCDVQLPVMDGYEIAQRMKNHFTLKRTPLIAVTALAMVGDREKILAAGFDGYIPKPIDPKSFVGQVEGFLAADQRVPMMSAPPERSPSTTDSGIETVPKFATILVLDNSPTNLDLICSTLEPSGYKVLFADRISDALTLACANRLDLILSDWHLTDETGFEFMQAIKANPKLKDVPFVFITSSIWGNKDRNRALVAGANKFLMRPIEPKELLAEIKDTLDKKRGGQSCPRF